MSEDFERRGGCRFGCTTLIGEPWADGYVRTANGKEVMLCSRCGRPQFVVERGARTVTTVHNGIKPTQRARILQRDGRCVMCSSKQNLQVGHLLSVADGLAQGLTEAEINHDANLAAMCAECNAGVGPRSVYPWIAIPIIRAYMRRLGGGTGGD
jgi:hypothetical protein